MTPNAGTEQPAGGCGDSTPARSSRPDVRLGARALGGGAARRHGRQPVGVRSRRPSRRRRWRTARTWCCRTCTHQATSITRASSYADGAQPRRCPTAADIEQPAGAAGRAVLHELAAPADPRMRSARRRQCPQKIAEYRRLLRRAEDPHDDRPADAAGRAAGGRRTSCRPGPASRPRRSWRSTTRPARSGRWSAGRSTATGLQQYPFNLATEGYRQPGSAFKAVHARRGAREHGYGPDSVHRLRAAELSSSPTAPARSTSSSTTSATRTRGRSRCTRRPPSPTTRVFTQVGMSHRDGTSGSRRSPRRWASARRSPTNYAMIIGGLKTGVSTLDMAHAYETFATGGIKVYNPTLGDVDRGSDRDRVRSAARQIICAARRARHRHPALPAGPPASVADGDPRRCSRASSRRRHRHRTRRSRASSSSGKTGTTSELRRRVVRRLDAADHDRGLGRVPEQSSCR